MNPWGHENLKPIDDADGPTHYINLASVVTRILEQEKVCLVLYIYTDWLTIYACKSNVLYHLCTTTITFYNNNIGFIITALCPSYKRQSLLVTGQ